VTSSPGDRDRRPAFGPFGGRARGSQALAAGVSRDWPGFGGSLRGRRGPGQAVGEPSGTDGRKPRDLTSILR
jgi:hypothetical protein